MSTFFYYLWPFYYRRSDSKLLYNSHHPYRISHSKTFGFRHEGVGLGIFRRTSHELLVPAAAKFTSSTARTRISVFEKASRMIRSFFYPRGAGPKFRQKHT
jgi:hypothetical protein